MTPASLKDLRKRLKNKDELIVKLLNDRARISVEIGEVKKQAELNVYDPPQENKVYRYLNKINDGPLPDEALREIFKEILSASRALQMPETVAFLGPEASFSMQLLNLISERAPVFLFNPRFSTSLIK